MSISQNDLTKHVLDTVYNVLMSSPDYATRLSLIGAYSLFREFKRVNIDYEKVGRMTADLDFNLYYGGVSESDYDVFKRSLLAALGSKFSVTFSPMKERRGSITYSFKVEYGGVKTPKLKIDFSLADGVKQFDCQPLFVSFAKKLALSNQFVDRRPKDKVDLYVVYRYLYPNGIHKADMLRLLKSTGNEFRVNTNWFTSEGIDLAFKSTKGFRGVDSNHLEFVMYFTQNLLRGLHDGNVPSNALFRNGEWVW